MVVARWFEWQPPNPEVSSSNPPFFFAIPQESLKQASNRLTLLKLYPNILLAAKHAKKAMIGSGEFF